MSKSHSGKVSADLRLRHFNRRLAFYELSLRNAVFPLTPRILAYAFTLLTAAHIMSFSPIDRLVAHTEHVLAGLLGSSLLLSIFCFLAVALPVCALFIITVRFGLTLMLYYNGWLFEEIGKPPSLPTKAFMLVLSFINKYATFMSYNSLLPWMPVPKLKDTVAKYLESVEPLMSKEEHDELNKKAAEFELNEGAGLQRKLYMKWMISRNYISDWWKEVVYMRYRDSLINTNVGCADIIYNLPTNNQAARAATVTLLRLQFCREYYNKQSMRPMGFGPIPLCPTQYKDYYRTLRVPRLVSDVMVTCGEARHVAVYHKGCWYKVNVYSGRRMIRTSELERALQHIIDHPETPVQGEEFLGSLTAGPRDLWAKTREEKFRNGLNRESLRLIEDALEILFLDDEERFYDEKDNSKYDREYQRALTGDGYKLWCDKPSVYIVSKNGRFSSNAEHSVVDAMIYVHVREYIKYHEKYSNLYLPDGHCSGDIDYVPTPERIHWEFDGEVLSAIDQAYTVSKAVADDFENASIVFMEYGKDFIKKAKVSPDAYIQMALQMAYFKDQGKFELTYEPAVMRLFRDGRTETVRSCSNQSCAFVRSMLSTEKSSPERLNLLKKACERHQDYARNAMAGKGVDRHLFGLYVVSKYYNIKSEFLDEVFKMNYAMSTSQTPQHQMAEYAKILNKDSDLFWPAGGFTCPDGSKYGICYTISASGDRLSFHVVSNKQFQETSCARFRDHLLDSLREMRSMVEDAVKA